MIKTLALSAILLGLGIHNQALAQFVPVPKPQAPQVPNNLDIYKIQYQFCIPEQTYAKFANDLINPVSGTKSRCRNVRTMYVWANQPPVPKARFLIKQQNNDKYEVNVKGYGCPNTYPRPQKLGWYMGDTFYVKRDVFNTPPELPLITKVEKVNGQPNGGSFLMPGMGRGCQFRGDA